ncbi:MAG TPA: NUDIX hydrolase [Anaerolineaceae bacterium]|uniref:Putative ADP-ribose pyrophosphatase n=1 Tax=Anaerolinea thermophila TaxID=167964 RepID=A0A117LGW6_9CHLR|nr:MAG: Putative ADP-ribose pyrophosphatase [Anaerolinea thermophila]HAF62393.1 NUDIX hydrolase [Anaerolineaceae bacterium]
MSTYCLLCGEKLQPIELEGRTRLACSRCGWIYYPQLKVSAGVLLEENEHLLLVQRAIEPWKGLWYLPAGYLEVDEDPITGAQRETREETGLQVSVTGLRSVGMYQDDPRGNGILILYNAIRTSGELTKGSESLDMGFFSKDEIKHLPLAGASHMQAIRQWIKEKEEGISFG